MTSNSLTNPETQSWLCLTKHSLIISAVAGLKDNSEYIYI